MINLVPLILSEAFPDLRGLNLVNALKFRLQQLSRIETLRYCIHLNLFISESESPRHDLTQQRALIRMFLNDRMIRRIERVSTRLRTQRHGHQLRLTVFHRQQLLELMCWTSLYCPNSGKYTTPVQNNQSKKMFVQAALIVSELVLRRMGDEQTLAGENTEVVRRHLLKLVRLSAQGASHAMDPIRAFGRGKMMFFDYLPKEFPDFEKRFQKHSGLSLSEYYSCLVMVIAHYLNVELRQSSHVRHIIKVQELREQVPQMVDVFSRYLELESQTIEELRMALHENGNVEQYSLKAIRQKPILRLSDGNAIVLDPVFHMEKAMAGPLFMLTGQFKDLLGHFGDAFEKYAQSILLKMYPQAGTDLRMGDDLKLMGSDGEVEIADACLIDGDRLLLFEMKAVWVRDDRVADRDHEGYLNELRQKYGKSGRIADQIARAINRLVSGEWTLRGHDMKDTRRIYPILIAYDPLLNTLGHPWFFRSEFSDALEPDGLLSRSKVVMVKNQWEIAPVTIITVDVLENLEASVRNFDLVDLLEDYFAFCDANFRDADDDLSLSTFISISGHNSKMDYRGSVVLKSLEIFEESMKMIVPEGTPSNSQAMCSV
jgi:hypothetical protein